MKPAVDLSRLKAVFTTEIAFFPLADAAVTSANLVRENT
jgi:hypothetical protein